MQLNLRDKSFFSFLWGMEKLEAIIFDYGGVIINIDYQATLRAFKDLGIDNIDEMYSQASQSNLFNDIETGMISPQFFVNQLLNFAPEGTSPNQIVSAWNAMILDVPKESIDLLVRLKEEGYRIFLLSNTNALHIDLANRRWKDVSKTTPHQMFEKVYYSHEVKMRKPSVEIFQKVLDENGLKPEQTLFIDDSIQHIEGAKKLDIRTLHLVERKNLLTYFS